MQLHTLFAELGLSPITSRRETRRAIGRPALRCRPDHHADAPAAGRKSLRGTRAYHLLRGHLTTIGDCSAWTGVKRLFRPADGRNCRFDGLLGRRRWMLPGPRIRDKV